MKAIVVLSGGQDSATCLALAVKKYGAGNVAAITFAYGQRHAIETKFAKRLTRLVPEALNRTVRAPADRAAAILHKIVRLDFYKHLTTNALLDPTLEIREQGQRSKVKGQAEEGQRSKVKGQAEEGQRSKVKGQAEEGQRSKVKGQTAESNLLCLTSDLGPLTSSHHLPPPNTVVEGRNAIFLQLAAVWAKTLGATEVYTGVSEADFSGYPDCRAAFIRAEEKAIRLALDYPIRIVTPFMHATKADEWALAAKLGIFDLVRNETVTCYNGIPGDGCGKCPACKLRNRGLKEYLSATSGRRHSCLRNKRK